MPFSPDSNCHHSRSVKKFDRAVGTASVELTVAVSVTFCHSLNARRRSQSGARRNAWYLFISTLISDVFRRSRLSRAFHRHRDRGNDATSRSAVLRLSGRCWSNWKVPSPCLRTRRSKWRAPRRIGTIDQAHHLRWRLESQGQWNLSGGDSGHRTAKFRRRCPASRRICRSLARGRPRPVSVAVQIGDVQRAPRIGFAAGTATLGEVFTAGWKVPSPFPSMMPTEVGEGNADRIPWREYRHQQRVSRVCHPRSCLQLQWWDQSLTRRNRKRPETERCHPNFPGGLPVGYPLRRHPRPPRCPVCRRH